MALAGTETVGDQMETPPSGDEKSEKVGNPFWSERAKEEAMVRSMRPSSLPDLSQVVEPGQSRTSTPTPLREALGGGLSGQDVGGLLQAFVEENEKRGRCWNCGSASHLSPDCTAPKASAEKDPKVKKQHDRSKEKPTGKKDVVEEVARETVVEKGEKPAAPTTSSAASSNAAEPGGTGMATEVVQLIRSMKTSVTFGEEHSPCGSQQWIFRKSST